MELGLWRDGEDSRPTNKLKKYELMGTLPGAPSVCSMKSAFIAGSECGDSSLADDEVVEFSSSSPCDDPLLGVVRFPRLTTDITLKEKCALLGRRCSYNVLLEVQYRNEYRLYLFLLEYLHFNSVV